MKRKFKKKKIRLHNYYAFTIVVLYTIIVCCIIAKKKSQGFGSLAVVGGVGSMLADGRTTDAYNVN